ncbi:MAG TPA: YoaK family protein [Acidimicrobiales bacterium]|nr:YoaK family protein [Acidimicrobiales bacterium]
MTTFFTDIRHTLVPSRTGSEGPLPVLLVAMTLVTGLVDAFSYLVLGHVFVANMTGNVVLLGFALAGAPGFSITASLAAILSFVAGAVMGGQLGARFGAHRARLLKTATLAQGAFLAVGVVLAGVGSLPLSAGWRYGLIVSLAVAMGIQNATARKLAVADLTTTVLTLTITGIAADSKVLGGKGSKAGRRLLAVAAMLLGAVVGAVLVLHSRVVVPLLVALVVILGVAAVTGGLSNNNEEWTTAEHQ